MNRSTVTRHAAALVASVLASALCLTAAIGPAQPAGQTAAMAARVLA